MVGPNTIWSLSEVTSEHHLNTIFMIVCVYPRIYLKVLVFTKADASTISDLPLGNEKADRSNDNVFIWRWGLQSLTVVISMLVKWLRSWEVHAWCPIYMTTTIRLVMRIDPLSVDSFYALFGSRSLKSMFKIFNLMTRRDSSGEKSSRTLIEFHKFLP